MCGIFGIVRHDGRAIDAEALQRMAATLRHRGPDHTGVHAEPHVALGTNRLAIIDLKTGDQPIYNEDRSRLIVFNGEIYNHRHLRRRLEAAGYRFATRADTEVVLHAFEAYGETCLDHLDGMYAFAIWDFRTRSLFLARDRLGIKPLYVAEPAGAFAFASEPKALLGVLDGPPRPDWTAIHRFFSIGYFPLEDCAFEGIRKFPAGHYGWLRRDRFSVTRHWRPSYGGGPKVPLADAVREADALAGRVVEKELESDVPVGVFLSGGLDSSLVALKVRQCSGAAVPAFTLGFEEDSHDESAAARRIAACLGLEHHAFRLSRDALRETLFRVAERLDEPFGDSTVLPLFALSELARREVKVVLTGWGGDELFAGYPTYRAHRLARAYRRLPGFLTRRLIPSLVDLLPVSDRYMSFEFKARRFVRGAELRPEAQHFQWMGYFSDAEKARLFRPEVLARVDEPVLAPLDQPIADLCEEDLVDRIMHLDALTFLEGNGLFQADRMSMAASLEARVPLLNNDMVAFASALPASVKMRRGRLKAVVREVLKPHLPADILRLPKKGFGPPSANWLRTLFADLVERSFAKRRVDQLGIFRHAEVRRLIDAHNSRHADHGRVLWLLLSFQLWYDRFIEGHALAEA